MKTKTEFMGSVQTTTQKPNRHGLALHHALHVKQAEYWLQLGEPAQALNQLKILPASAKQNGWALKVHVAALHGARQQNMLS